MDMSIRFPHLGISLPMWEKQSQFLALISLITGSSSLWP